jgi:leucyl-tRNA synthetase
VGASINRCGLDACRLCAGTWLAVEHPLDAGWHLPTDAANFVLTDYGTGAIFGCSEHDQRYLDFTRKHHLPVTRVAADGDLADSVFEGEVTFTGPSTIVNSHWMDGMTIDQARANVIGRAQAEA